MRAVGIDIGTYSVKVAEVEPTAKPGGVRLLDYFEFPLNLDPKHDDRIERLEIIKRLSLRYPAATHKTVVGLSSEYVSQRNLVFPFSERRKILQSLPFELEDSIPFSQKDAIFDFKILGTAHNNSKVLALAVPKRYVKNTLELFLDAGLDPDVISIDGMALSNLFENYLQPSKLELNDELTTPASLVIHIGYAKTIVLVVVDGALLLTRTVLFGGRDMAQSISRVYSLPYLESLKAVAEKGFFLTSKEGATGDQIAFSDTLSNSIQPLLSEVQRTMLEVKAEYKVQFDKAWLTGGLGNLINMGPYFTQILEVPTNTFNHLASLERVDVPLTTEVERGSAVAVALAIEGLKKPRNPAVNLRKQEFSKQGQNLSFFFQSNKALIAMASIAYLIFLIYSVVRVDMAQNNVSAVESALRTTLKNPNLAGAGSLKGGGVKSFIREKQNEITARHDVIRYTKMVPGLEVLRKLSQATPPKNQVTLDVREFSLVDEILRVDGEVASKNEVDQIAGSWRKLDFVNKLNIDSPRRQAGPGKIPFSMTIALRRLPPSQKKD